MSGYSLVHRELDVLGDLLWSVYGVGKGCLVVWVRVVFVPVHEEQVLHTFTVFIHEQLVLLLVARIQHQLIHNTTLP